MKGSAKLHPNLPYFRLELQLAYVGARDNDFKISENEPLFLGPLMRRCVGNALAKLSCALLPPICRKKTTGHCDSTKACVLAENCAFGVMYAKSRSSVISGGVNALAPFSLYVPTVINAQSLTQMEVALYGTSWPFYFTMIRACAQALAEGVGPSRDCYEIHAVLKEGADGGHSQISGKTLTTIDRNSAPNDLEKTLLSDFEDDEPVSISLLSPTRLVQNGKLLKGDNPIPFSVIIESILARLRDHYGQETVQQLPGASAETFRVLAKEVTLLNSDIQWIDIPDHGKTRDKRRILGGKIGCLTYDAPAGRFLPLLRAGEILHIGKNAASGCGRMAIGKLPVM